MYFVVLAEDLKIGPPDGLPAPDPQILMMSVSKNGLSPWKTVKNGPWHQIY